MVLTGGLTDGSARAEGDVGAEGRVGFRGFRGEAVPALLFLGIAIAVRRP